MLHIISESTAHNTHQQFLQRQILKIRINNKLAIHSFSSTVECAVIKGSGLQGGVVFVKCDGLAVCVSVPGLGEGCGTLQSGNEHS